DGKGGARRPARTRNLPARSNARPTDGATLSHRLGTGVAARRGGRDERLALRAFLPRGFRLRPGESELDDQEDDEPDDDEVLPAAGHRYSVPPAARQAARFRSI